MYEKEPLAFFQIIDGVGLVEDTVFSPTEDEIRELCVKHEVDPDGILRIIRERALGGRSVIVNAPIYKTFKETEQS